MRRRRRRSDANLKEKIQSWQTVFKIFCGSFERFVVGSFGCSSLS